MNSRAALFFFWMIFLFGLTGAALDRLAGRGNAFTLLCLGAALLINAILWAFSDRIVLSRSGAKPLPKSRAPRIHRMTDQLSKRAGLPKPPRLFWTEDAAPNAFATGRGPGAAAVCITRGLSATLDESEARAVLAHEIAHIRRRDTLASSALAAIASAIGRLGGASGSSSVALGARFLSGLRRSFWAAGWLALAPLLASLTLMAASRSREFAADAEAARLLGGSRDMIRALKTMQSAVEKSDDRPAAAGLLMTIDPRAGRIVDRLTRTHPPLAQRIARLESLDLS